MQLFQIRGFQGVPQLLQKFQFIVKNILSVYSALRIKIKM